MKSKSISPARLAAFEILARVEEGSYASVLLTVKQEQLELRDRALCHELVMGVLRRQLWLDHLIEFYSNRKVAALDSAVRVILRLGLYQLRFLSRIPASAAVNESVNLITRARVRSASGLVNAVLRRATREPEADPISTVTDPLQRLAVSTSHPAWLLERWISAFGAQEAEAFAHANNEAPAVAFRVVKNRAAETDVYERLRQAGAQISPSQLVKNARRIEGAMSLLAEMAAAGEVYIQDEASQLAAAALAPKPGEKVLDLCAAPGSKTTLIADNCLDSAFVVASDQHEHRLRTVISSAKRQGFRSIQCVALNGLAALPFSDSTFDRVLVDAPCSGTGTLRRNPEIRWRISSADINDLAARQKQLLSNASRVVKPGGRLVYSTCSVEPEENEAVVHAFLENNPDFQPCELLLDQSVITAPGTCRTWPHRHGIDGFFISAFERKTD